MRVLKKSYLFRNLSESQLQRVALALQVVRFNFGQTIFKQGDISSDFFMVRQGRISIVKDGKTLRTLGKRAVIFKEPRSASVFADEDYCEFWKISWDICM